MKKVIVIGVIALFVCVGFQPALSNEVSIDSSRVLSNFNMENHPPDIPKVAGELPPNVGVEYEYSIWTTDPDGDDVSYYIDWGDGNTTGWIGPFASGCALQVLHAWYESGTYLFRCKAKDHPYEAESDWFEYLIIVPPKDKTYSKSSADNIEKEEDCIECQSNDKPICEFLLNLQMKLELRVIDIIVWVTDMCSKYPNLEQVFVTYMYTMILIYGGFNLLILEFGDSIGCWEWKNLN